MSDEELTTGTAGDDFGDLAAAADQIDGAAASQVEAHAVAKLEEADNLAANMVADLVDVLKMARGMAGAAFAWWPDFERVWNDDVLNGIAVNGATIMVRHGWTMGRLMTEWGPYLGLLGCVAPAAFATVQAIKAKKAGAYERHQQSPD